MLVQAEKQGGHESNDERDHGRLRSENEPIAAVRAVPVGHKNTRPMKTKWLSVVCCLPLICGCSALSVAPTANSRFTSETVRLGMTKEQFVEQFGRPFKESFFRDEHGRVAMKRFTTRNLWDRGMPSTRSFRFEDSVLVAQEQGDEERLYSTAASKIDRNRRFPSASAAFGPSRIKTDLSARTGKKGPDFRHAAHPRGNTQRSQDRVGAPELPHGKRKKKGCPENSGQPLFRAFYLQPP